VKTAVHPHVLADQALFDMANSDGAVLELSGSWPEMAAQLWLHRDELYTENRPTTYQSIRFGDLWSTPLVCKNPDAYRVKCLPGDPYEEVYRDGEFTGEIEVLVEAQIDGRELTMEMAALRDETISVTERRPVFHVSLIGDHRWHVEARLILSAQGAHADFIYNYEAEEVA